VTITSGVVTADQILILVLAPHDEVDPVIEETVAEGGTDVPVLAIAVNGLGPIAVELSPFELIIEDDVVDPRDGTRAVRRRRASGDYVDAADEDLRDELRSTLSP